MTSDIDRREAIRRVSLLLGGTLSLPAITGILAGCTGERESGASWKPRALSAKQGEMVATIAEQIIPRTDTPGARDAGVHRFVDEMMADYYPAGERARFLAGLADLDERARRGCGNDFLACAASEQASLLAVLDREAVGRAASRTEPHWFRTMKELTLLGYYTSEAGLTKELGWVQVPGRYDGCVPLDAGRGSRTT